VAARSENLVIIIGNLTRDPDLRYTPQGNAVVSFGVATNREWTTADGTKREDTQFHEIVAWNRLAEICKEFLGKGCKVYIKGRLQTRTWEDDNDTRHYRTEIVADDMIVLEGNRSSEAGETEPTEVKPETQEESGEEEAPVAVGGAEES